MSREFDDLEGIENTCKISAPLESLLEYFEIVMLVNQQRFDAEGYS